MTPTTRIADRRFGLTLALAACVCVGSLEARGQLQWSELPDLAPRDSGHALAHDPVRDRVWLFGGDQKLFDDTWEWDGHAWRRRYPAASPRGRQGACMAFDPVKKTMLLFGGGDDKATFGDTWQWDGRNWRQLQPKTSPSRRWYASMAFDPRRNRIVMFGGSSAVGSGFNVVPLKDTWEWTGTDWTQLQPKTVPPARAAASMAWCSRTARVVLFGGTNGQVSVPNDTWEWTGSDWVRHSVGGPAARIHAVALGAKRFGHATGYSRQVEARP